MTKFSQIASISFAALALGVTGSGKALAQQTGSAPGTQAVPESEGEIIVTARKREESILRTPVVMTAVTAADLDKYALTSFNQISSRVPGLIIADTTIEGSNVVLRGISSPFGTPLADKSVSVNIDGVQLNQGNILRSAGQIDVRQVEVLRGPQALFFGKNSPAGIIAIKSADPGDRFEARGRFGYEFEAAESNMEGMISGPLAPGVGLRIAGTYREMEGWLTNAAPVLPAAPGRPQSLGADRRHNPEQQELFLRGTLLLEPTERLTVRAKVSYDDLDTSGVTAAAQLIDCPNGGVPTVFVPGVGAVVNSGGLDRCSRTDNTVYVGAIPQEHFAVVENLARFKNGQNQSNYKFTIASLEANFEINDWLTLTSVTGYLEAPFYDVSNFFIAAEAAVTAATHSSERQLSEELRLTTNSDGPINAMIGAYWEDRQQFALTQRVIDARLFGVAAPGPNCPAALGFTLGVYPYCGDAQVAHDIDGNTQSVFGQAIWNITDQIELSGGVRYTHETRDRALTRNGVPLVLTGRAQHVSFNNTSPEATVTFRPNNDLTLFTSYKEGFKSGSYDASFGATATNAYRPETVRGLEAGFKARLLGGRMLTDGAAYSYRYKDQQVSLTDPTTVAQTILNAASSQVEGAEFNVTYAPEWLEGLDLRGGINYNVAEYRSFIVDCYTGQLIADGCNLSLNPATGRFTRQSLAGKQLDHAPEWVGNFGIAYDGPLVGEWKLGLNSDLNYSSGYNTRLTQIPTGYQDAFTKLDASASVYNGNLRFSLIGRNLTDEYTISNSSYRALSGISTRTGTNTPGGQGDTYATVSRGRQVMVQFTYNH